MNSVVHVRVAMSTSSVDFTGFAVVLVTANLLLANATSAQFGAASCPPEVKKASNLFKVPGNRFGRLVEIYSVEAGGIINVTWKSPGQVRVIEWPQRKSQDAEGARLLREAIVSQEVYFRHPNDSSSFLVVEWNHTSRRAVLTVSTSTPSHSWNFTRTRTENHLDAYKICTKVDETDVGGNSKETVSQEYCLYARRKYVGLRKAGKRCPGSACLFTYCEEQQIGKFPLKYGFANCSWTNWS